MFYTKSYQEVQYKNQIMEVKIWFS